MNGENWYTSTEEKAFQFAKRHSISALWVVVEGPEEDRFTAMPIEDAIENGFFYSWYC